MSRHSQTQSAISVILHKLTQSNRIRLEIRRSPVRSPPGPATFSRGLVEVDHEIFSTVIPSITSIQEGQLSVSGTKRAQVLINRLGD